jgi:hypothetical protein
MEFRGYDFDKGDVDLWGEGGGGLWKFSKG